MEIQETYLFLKGLFVNLFGAVKYNFDNFSKGMASAMLRMVQAQFWQRRHCLVTMTHPNKVMVRNENPNRPNGKAL